MVMPTSTMKTMVVVRCIYACIWCGVMHVCFGQLWCTWELNQSKQDLVFVLLAKAAVAFQHLVQRLNTAKSLS